MRTLSAAAAAAAIILLILCAPAFAAGPRVLILPFDAGINSDWTGRGVAEIIEYMLNGGSQADSYRQLAETIKGDLSRLYADKRELLLKTAAARKDSFIIAGSVKALAPSAGSGLKIEIIAYDMKAGKESRTIINTTKDAMAGGLQKFCDEFFSSNKIS